MHTRVFVYGTLKEGFPNFGTNTETRIPGVFVTTDRYPLYLVGERHSPWMVNTPGEGERVVGQVFEVKPEVLERIDILQRVSAPDGYERIQITVRSQSIEPEDELLVHAYLKHPRNLAGAEILAGPFSEYTLEHAALYRKRALKPPVGADRPPALLAATLSAAPLGGPSTGTLDRARPHGREREESL